VLTSAGLRIALADTSLRALAGIVLAVLALALLVRPETIGGPLAGEIVPWPLLSCVAPLALATLWHSPLAALERSSVRGPFSPALGRLAIAGALIALATLVVSLAAPTDGSPVAGDGAVAWRNAGLVAGLALAGAAWLAASSAWIPATAYVLACVAAGVPSGGEPYAWTLLFRPDDDAAALAIAIATFAVGLAGALWSLRRPRLR
jgi:hypothetical protein